MIVDRSPARPGWSRLVNPYAVERDGQSCRSASLAVGALLMGATGLVLGAGTATAQERQDGDTGFAASGSTSSDRTGAGQDRSEVEPVGVRQEFRPAADSVGAADDPDPAGGAHPPSSPTAAAVEPGSSGQPVGESRLSSSRTAAEPTDAGTAVTRVESGSSAQPVGASPPSPSRTGAEPSAAEVAAVQPDPEPSGQPTGGVRPSPSRIRVEPPAAQVAAARVDPGSSRQPAGEWRPSPSRIGTERSEAEVAVARVDAEPVSSDAARPSPGDLPRPALLGRTDLEVAVPVTGAGGGGAVASPDGLDRDVVRARRESRAAESSTEWRGVGGTPEASGGGTRPAVAAVRDEDRAGSRPELFAAASAVQGRDGGEIAGPTVIEDRVGDAWRVDTTVAAESVTPSSATGTGARRATGTSAEGSPPARVATAVEAVAEDGTRVDRGTAGTAVAVAPASDDVPLWQRVPRRTASLPDGRLGVVIDVQSLVGTGDPRDRIGSVVTLWDPKTGERYAAVQPTVSRSGKVFIPQMSDELVGFEPTGNTAAVYRLGPDDTGRVNSRIPVARLHVPEAGASVAARPGQDRRRPVAVPPPGGSTTGRVGGVAPGSVGGGATGPVGAPGSVGGEPTGPTLATGATGGDGTPTGQEAAPSSPDGRTGVTPGSGQPGDGSGPDSSTDVPGTPIGGRGADALAEFLRVDPDFDLLDPQAWTPTAKTAWYTGLGAVSSSYVFARVLQQRAAAAGLRLSFPAAVAGQAWGQPGSIVRDLGLLGINNQTILEDPVADATAKATIGTVFSISTQEFARRVLNPIANRVAANRQAWRLARYLDTGKTQFVRGLDLASRPNIRFDSPLPNSAFAALNFGVPFALLGSEAALEAAGRSDIPGLRGIDENYWAKLGAGSLAVGAGICVPVMLVIRKPLFDTCGMLGGQIAVAGLVTEPPEGVELGPVVEAVRETCAGDGVVGLLGSLACHLGEKPTPPRTPPGAPPLTIPVVPGSGTVASVPPPLAAGVPALWPDTGRTSGGQVPVRSPYVEPGTSGGVRAGTRWSEGGPGLQTSPAFAPQPAPTAPLLRSTQPTTQPSPQPTQRVVGPPTPSPTPQPAGAGGPLAAVRRWASDRLSDPVTMTRSDDGSRFIAAGGVPFTPSAYVAEYDAETGRRISTTSGNPPPSVNTAQFMDPRVGVAVAVAARSPRLAAQLLRAAGPAAAGSGQLVGAGALGAVLPVLPDLPEVPRAVREGWDGLVDRVQQALPGGGGAAPTPAERPSTASAGGSGPAGGSGRQPAAATGTGSGPAPAAPTRAPATAPAPVRPTPAPARAVPQPVRPAPEPARAAPEPVRPAPRPAPPAAAPAAAPSVMQRVQSGLAGAAESAREAVRPLQQGIRNAASGVRRLFGGS